MPPTASASRDPASLAADTVDAVDTSGAFTVELLLFAVHAERLGRPVLRVGLPAGASVASLRDALAREGHAALLAGQVRVAVNQRLVDEAEPIREGDEVALIPPVAGG